MASQQGTPAGAERPPRPGEAIALAGTMLLAVPALRRSCRRASARTSRPLARAVEVFPRQVAAACDVELATATPAAAESKARGIGRIVERLYDNFNRCDVDGTTACFTDDVVYEDLLLGNATVVESREDFRELIQTHPVFLARRACVALRLPPLDIAVRVDGISEDSRAKSVGVEWHVEFGGEKLPLGRGLSFMRVCPRTGLICRAVDIAEAPWRVVGILLAPVARVGRGVQRLTASLLLPPLLVGWSSALILVGFIIVFLDRTWMHDLRADVDALDDFRTTMNVDSASGLMDLLKEVSGLYPWENWH